MANTWIKLYHEILNDPTMGTMPDHLFRRTIELFLLAGQEEKDGRLPNAAGIAWALHTTEKDVKTVIEKLEKLNIITSQPDGYFVTHFSDRQNTQLSDAERQQRRRDKSKASRELSDARHADQVTADTETITETSRELSDAETEIITNKSDARPEKVTLDKDKDKDKEEDKDSLLNNLNINNSLVVNKHNAAEAAAREKPAKQKLSHDQPEFWQRAFGPEADRAKAFSAASGIIPISGEFGRWQKDLRAFTEAGISTEQMIRAVEKVRKDGKYPIKAPGTVFTEARNITAGNPVSKSFADIAAEYEKRQQEPDPVWDIIDL